MARRRSQTVGIGVITCNRLPALEGCVAGVLRYTTTPFELVVADDGSTDGSAEWARERNLTVITGQRRRVTWNKNRALYYLMESTACDPIITLDDDCWPTEAGWDRAWIAAAVRWGHVCFTFLGPKPDPTGSGTPEDPYRGLYFGGPCTATTRSALRKVGYYETRMRGHGWDDIDWTYRFERLLSARWRGEPHTCPSMVFGLKVIDFGSHYDPEENERNRQVLLASQNEPIWRPPWRTPEEEAIVRAEQEAGKRSRQ